MLVVLTATKVPNGSSKEPRGIRGLFFIVREISVVFLRGIIRSARLWRNAWRFRERWPFSLPQLSVETSPPNMQRGHGRRWIQDAEIRVKQGTVAFPSRSFLVMLNPKGERLTFDEDRYISSGKGEPLLI